jgi:hypothetical protein
VQRHLIPLKAASISFRGGNSFSASKVSAKSIFGALQKPQFSTS